ncbi:MAG: GFA family protein [Candidatus Andeanibacterium colombiense]|uniref:GFA family protein n=1 Tax=Candidatus Andeanibacterium colombiense TaxID=3121345 RepID=A0AAJ5XA11_9SPHN|nr:MAG: GFA family protein [Sphingomonadaceae bacterium]
MPTIAADLTGGCLCGTVRYRLTAQPFDLGWCHCRMCQLNSGSPAMVFGSVALDDYAIQQGAEAIRKYCSSEKAERWFCGECGTPLLFRELDGRTYDFSVATLDDPGAAPPEKHIYYSSHIPWAEAADDRLPRYPQSSRG